MAVIDEGIDFSHPDLSGQQWVNSGEIAGNGWDDDGNGYVDDINGWDFYNWDRTVYDSYDGDTHGTHVAGTIAANLNGQGVVGVAPKVKVMSLKICGPDGCDIAGAIDALSYAAWEGVPVANASWGGPGYSQALKDAIDYSDLLFVAAAGNGGADGVGDNNDYYPDYPASYTSPNILSVAAIDNRGYFAGFSNYGPASVDISAPGVDIASTYAGGGHVWMSGTSMAAPHATGVAALVASADPTLTPIQIKAALMSTGKASPYTSGWTVTGKIIDAYAAVSSVAPAPSDTTPPSGTVKINSGATYTNNVLVNVSAPATDDASGVSSICVSNGGEYCYLYSYAPDFAWDLSDPDIGGSTTNGARHVDVWWQDGAGNWSDAVSDTIVLDTVLPTVAAPTHALISNSTLGTSTVPIKVSWSGSDATSGVAKYQAQQRRYVSGAWQVWSSMTSGTTAKSLTRQLAPGRYQFQVRAQDRAGNWSGWKPGVAFTVAAYDQSSTVSAGKVSYGGTWSGQSHSSHYGGSVRHSSTKGATASFSFTTGKQVAWVAPKGANRGYAHVYLDGSKVATVNLYYSSTLYRRAVFVRGGLNPSVTHTLKVYVSGTKPSSSSGTRVDVDAFVVIR